MLLILALMLSILNLNKAQLLAQSNYSSILIFPELELAPYIDSSTSNNQNISVASFVENNEYIYVLSTNGAIQVHSKSNPNNIMSSMLQFYHSTYPSNIFLQTLVINQAGSTVVAIGIQDNITLIYFFYQAGSMLQFLYQKEMMQIAEVPFFNFFANSTICSFFSSTLQNDSFTCLDYD